jgi:hypothetical protein
MQLRGAGNGNNPPPNTADERLLEKAGELRGSSLCRSREVFRGKTVWQGDVEVVTLTWHPKAKRCHGWSYGEPEQSIIILELPPVDSAQAAVKVGVAFQAKQSQEPGRS